MCLCVFLDLMSQKSEYLLLRLLSMVSNYNTGRPVTTAKLASWLPRVERTTPVAMSHIDTGSVA